MVGSGWVVGLIQTGDLGKNPGFGSWPVAEWVQ